MGFSDIFKLRNKNTKNRGQLLFQNEFLIVGEKYECQKNHKKKRPNVIKKTNTKSPVHIEKYLYKGVPAYMVVNTKLNLDLGVLSGNAAAWLTDYYSKGETKAVLTDKFKESFHVKISVYEDNANQ